MLGKAHRVSLVQTVPSGRQLERSSAVTAVLESIANSEADDLRFGVSFTGTTEATGQQIRPVEAVPSGFLQFESSNRPNPLLKARGATVLDMFQSSVPYSRSLIGPTEKLYRPQGTHLLTGQAFPPIFNDAGRQATGEDISNLCTPGFSFQGINNNYKISAAQPG